MKNYLLAMFAVIGFAACKKDVDPAVQPVDVEVKVAYAEKFADYNFPVTNVSLKLTNQRNSKVLEAKTDVNGVYTFPDASAGVYNVDASITIPAATYTQITGIDTDVDVIFQATIKNLPVNQAVGGDVSLQLTSGRIGNWVIKQVNYGGSHRTDGALFRDQFVEIYNNSSDTLYADSLYLVDVYNSVTISPDQSKGYYLPGGQFDWTKSIGMPATVKANDDYLYSKSIYMVPGTGHTYPVVPGASIVIAQTALNHKAPFTNGNGTVVTVVKPELTIDLSNASFEVYLGEGFASDLDIPNIPNMVVIQPFGNDYVLDNTGRNAWVIFQTSDDVKNWNKYPDPVATSVTAATKLYYQLPKSIVIDGVETQANAIAQYPKKLDATIDAGFTYLPKGAYTSQAIIRKVVKTVDGRRILQDTNNSTNDIENVDISIPFGFK